MSDNQFIECFISGRMPAEGFDHQAHLRAACLLLGTHPFLEACIAMRDGLRCIASKAGKPDLYHETITVAFMALVSERMATCDGGWQALVATDRDLLNRELLHRYYSRERLASLEARKTFTLPDRTGVAA